MRTLRVLPEAEEEFGKAAECYEGKRPGLGLEVVLHVQRQRPPAVRTVRNDS
jgi:hypothetical protein